MNLDRFKSIAALPLSNEYAEFYGAKICHRGVCSAKLCRMKYSK